MTLVGVAGDAGAGTGTRGWPERARPVVGMLVLTLWLVWAALAWLVEPRSVDVDQLRADIASGQIVTYRVTGTDRSERAWPPSATADGWDTLGLDEATGLPGSGTGNVVATGIQYWVEGSYAQTRHLDASSSPVPWQDLVGEMRAGGVPLEAPLSYQPLYGDTPFGPGRAAILLGFGSVLLAYRPTRVTRWGWLWLTAVVPLGLGLVALAVAELVRPTAAPGQEHEHRLRGGKAFLLAWALNVIVVITAGQLSRSVDALWMP
ncbi:hypothetical protein [Knoellia sp. p5-6-4]|uniref:hypothetical protein n=1 Tax=unclassified Knoellia TaxID=2618719 RepID=UPI0023D9BBAB|nr:hypothetical protein [Knoellia sp. p5-6-4]MDF2144773.1 hypothetical protein [Knoellia sp. p5-6-4]